MRNVRIPRDANGKYALETFPGLESNPTLSRAALDLQYGILPPPGKFNCHKHVYYSAKAYALTGATNFTFFDQAPARFVESLPQQGQINDDQFFWIENLTFEVIPNVTIAALAQTTTAANLADGAVAGGYVGAATLLPVSVQHAAQLACIYKLGLVNLKVGSRQLIEDAWGLQEFAVGGGPVTNGAAASNSATTAIVGPMHTNNGGQTSDVGWFMSPDAWLTKGRTVTCSVDFRTAIPLGSSAGGGGAGVIIARLEGTRITTGNV